MGPGQRLFWNHVVVGLLELLPLIYLLFGEDLVKLWVALGADRAQWLGRA